MDKITEYCTGCRMCEKICPKKAITMIENKEGFLVTKIDTQKCINCGLCKKNCPQNTKSETESEFKKIGYAVTIKDDMIKKSSSGGIFVAISKMVLDRKGAVYGAAYNENLVVNHVRVVDIEQLKKLQGSKYVQSNTGNTYIEVKKDLEKNKIVLYSGTPCQIAGLKKFLKKDYDNLITIDLICHGVPSPKLFKNYIEYISTKDKKTVKQYDFRTKDKKDWSIGYYYYYTNKGHYKSGDLDPYYYNFLKGTTYRECCYACKYANLNRVGDLTIGDYWGIEDTFPEFFDKKGVSCVIVNSEKGKKVFDEVKRQIKYIKVPLDDISRKNHNLNCPTKRPVKRNDIYNEIDDKNIVQYFEKKLKVPMSHRLVYYRRKITELIPKSIKRTIKKFLK